MLLASAQKPGLSDITEPETGPEPFINRLAWPLPVWSAGPLFGEGTTGLEVKP